MTLRMAVTPVDLADARQPEAGPARDGRVRRARRDSPAAPHLAAVRDLRREPTPGHISRPGARGDRHPPGRGTFSAAGNFVTDLKVGPQKAGITLVGEPPGGGLDIYGDVKVVTLPASRIVVLIAGRYHERAPGDDRLEIEPDVPVQLTWEDYASGRDPVFDAARTP